jgi:hypothetical protein
LPSTATLMRPLGSQNSQRKWWGCLQVVIAVSVLMPELKMGEGQECAVWFRQPHTYITQSPCPADHA